LSENEIVDQDELQMMDELNEPWVKAWKEEGKKVEQRGEM